MSTTANPALAAAADFDLYRVVGSANPVAVKAADWRRADGTPVDSYSVHIAISVGLLGEIAPPELLPDGVRAQRMDLSDAGLDYMIRRQAA